MYILNGFSMNMLDIDEGDEVHVHVRRISVAAARAHIVARINAGLPVRSAIGHANTAAIISDMLNFDVPMNRVDVKLPVAGVELPFALLAQYRGPRLPEGATALPEGAAIDWYVVETKPVAVPA